jgi:hypothetical protein
MVLGSGAMLTIDEVRGLAVAEGLAEFADCLVDTVRPGWRLDLHARAEAPLGGSKIGGDPDLLLTESWPTNHRGVPMTFLAQVNGDELPAVAPEWATSVARLPRGLLLRVFADLVDQPYDPGPARVLAATIPAELVRTPAPDLPAPWPPGGDDNLSDDERVRRLPEAAVTPTAFLTAPATHPVLDPEGASTDSMAMHYGAWAYRLRLDGRDYNADAYEDRMPWEVHHLLGEESSEQITARFDAASMVQHTRDDAQLGFRPNLELAHPEAWTTLLSLHDDEKIGLFILDAGSYTVLVPTADLLIGSFERALCTMHSC